MKIFLILTFLFISLFTCYSQSNNHWVYCCSSTDGAKWYFKSNYESKEDGITKIWTKTILKTFTYKKRIYKNAYTLSLNDFNCKGKLCKLSSAIYYSNNGNVIADDDVEDQWRNIIPESVIEEVFNKVCSYFQEPGNPLKY